MGRVWWGEFVLFYVGVRIFFLRRGRVGVGFWISVFLGGFGMLFFGDFILFIV